MITAYQKLVVWLITFIVASSSLFGQQIDSLSKNDWIRKGYLNGYGIVNYYDFSWDTDPNRRNSFDAERLNLYLGYHFNDWIEFKSEIEFEHGGTGSTLEFDILEEFGEFEQEIEAGGEVILEQLNVQFKLKDWLNIRVGKFRLYMGLAAQLDDPTEYFTTHRSEVENTILPLGWYEHGIEITGKISKKWSYKFYLINGLDASGFSSANWVRRGYQKRFESVNANNMAVVGRLDYHFNDNSEIGFSAYYGNSTGNRPKNDTDVDGYVGVYDFHFLWENQPFRARAYAVYGSLTNSEIISDLNRNLSNNLNVKRTPVASSALGLFVEMAYDVLSFSKIKNKNNHQLYLFGRFDYYDSMWSTQGDIFDNPRWERRVITGGLNYYPHPQVVLKAQFSNRELGSNETENTFSCGMGFKF